MTSMRPVAIALTGILIFQLAMTAGLAMARYKPLWLDEIYSQDASIERISWGQIWRGKISEGNNSPLFYTIQKTISAALDCQGRDLWHNDDMKSRIILRICPVFFMSIGIALIVIYFMISGGTALAVLGLVSTITSYLVWGYWAEARPYAMVFFGTTLQALTLDQLFRKGASPSRFAMVVIAHWFLSLTSALSVIQVTAASFVLWSMGYRKYRDILLYAVLPLAAGFGYRAVALQHRIWFPPQETPISLFLSNISNGRLLIIILFPCISWLLWRFKKWEIPQGFGQMVAWSWLTMVGYIILLGYMKSNSCASAPGCAEVSTRYFMTLTPVGIIMLLTCSIALLRQAHDAWMKWTIWVTILVITLPRLSKAWSWAMAYHLFDFFGGMTGGSS